MSASERDENKRRRIVWHATKQTRANTSAPNLTSMLARRPKKGTKRCSSFIGAFVRPGDLFPPSSSFIPVLHTLLLVFIACYFLFYLCSFSPSFYYILSSVFLSFCFLSLSFISSVFNHYSMKILTLIRVA
jgi:hypothetical protein